MKNNIFQNLIINLLSLKIKMTDQLLDLEPRFQAKLLHDQLSGLVSYKNYSIVLSDDQAVHQILTAHIDALKHKNYPTTLLPRCNPNLAKLLSNILCEVCDTDDDDIYLVKALVECGTNVNAGDNDKESPLIKAAIWDNTEICVFLLQNGATSVRSAYYHFCRSHNLRLVRMCVNMIDINTYYFIDQGLGLHHDDPWSADYYKKFVWFKFMIANGIKADLLSAKRLIGIINQEFDAIENENQHKYVHKGCLYHINGISHNHDKSRCARLKTCVKTAEIIKLFVLVNRDLDLSQIGQEIEQLPTGSRYNCQTGDITLENKMDDPEVQTVSRYITDKVLPIFKMTRHQIYLSLDPKAVNNQKYDFKIMMLKRYSTTFTFNCAIAIYEHCGSSSCLRNYFKSAFANMNYRSQHIIIRDKLKQYRPIMMMVLKYYSPKLFSKYKQAFALAIAKSDLSFQIFLGNFGNCEQQVNKRPRYN